MSDDDTKSDAMTVEAAERILRAAYAQDIRDIVENAIEECKSGSISDRDELDEWIHETIDSHGRCIYTHKSLDTLMWSDNDSAYVDEFGSEGMCDNSGIKWGALAFAAMRADVNDLLGAYDEELEAIFNPPDEDEEESDDEDESDDEE